MKDNIIKTESGDIIQFLLGKYNNHQIHCAVYFDEHLDIDVFYKTTAITMKMFPILQSRFILGKIPFWKVDEHLHDRAITILKCCDSEESSTVDRILTSTINFFEGPQIQFTVVKSEKRDILCIRLNHMVSDVGGLKDYLYQFSSIYTQLVLEGNPTIDYAISRDFRQITSRLSTFKKLTILIRHYPKNKNLKTAGRSLHFDLSGGSYASSFILKRRLSSDKYETLHEYSKKQHVTINDILMTAFIRTIYRSMQISKTESITIPCPVDIRRYFTNIKESLFCNLSPVIFCNIGTDIGDTFQDTLAKVKFVMDGEKRNLPDAKIASNLKLQFLVSHIPFNWFKMVFLKIFPNPAFVMTNIGIIQKEKLMFGKFEPSDIFMSGSVKEPPALQLAVSTYDHKLTFTINLRGSDSDKEKMNSFMDLLLQELPQSSHTL